MSEITVGSVGVNVVPNARGFGREAARQINPEAAKIGREFGTLFGQSAERQMAEGVREGLREGAKTATPDGVRAGTQYGRGVKRGVSAALKDPATLKLEADIKSAQAKVKALREFAEKKLQIDADIARLQAKLAALSSRGVRIDADITAAEAKLAELRRAAEEATGEKRVRIDADISAAEAKLRQLSATRVSIDADTAAATAKLQALEAKVDEATRNRTVDVDANIAAAEAELARLTARRQQIEVDVDVDTAAASAQLALMRGNAIGASTGLLAVVGAAALLGPALIPVGAVGVGAMAAIASGALVAASGVGVLVLALAPVIAAVQALRQANDASARSARSTTSAHLQMAAAMDAVESAHRAVASAEEDARIAGVRAAEQVADARRRLADAERQAADDQVEAAHRVEDAERDLAQAQRDSLDAVEALNEAREQAARDMEDLASRVAHGALDERDAVLRVAEAQQRLSEVQADPNATELERQRAQLALEQAIQGLQDQRTELARLREEQAAAAEAGVEGSERVRNAHERVRESQERVRGAQQGVAEAVRAAAETQRRSAERVAEAQRGVAEAVREAADSQRRSAEAIEAAQQGVISAQRGVQQASQAAGLAGGAAMDTVRSKMAALTPEGRKFVGFVTGTLIPALSPLTKAAQAGLLPGLQQALAMMVPILPAVARFVGTLASTMGQLAVEAAKSLSNPAWQAFFAYLERSAGPILVSISRILGNFAQGFAGLLVAFEPVTDAIFRGLENLSRGFAEFGTNAGENAGFQAFIAYLREVGPQVVGTLAEVGRAFGHILAALAPLGPVVLGVIRGLAQFIQKVPPVAIQAIAIAIGVLAVALGVASAAAGVFASTAGLIVAGVVVAIGVIVAWVLVFKHLYETHATLRKIVDAVWTTVRDVVVSAWQDFIQPALQALVDFVTQTLVPAFQTYMLPILQAVWSGIQVAVTVAWAVIRAVFVAIDAYVRNVLAPVFLFFWHNVIEPAWTGIRVAITIAWGLIRLVFAAIELYVRAVLMPIFNAFLAVARVVWSGISAAISAAWTLIRPIFEKLGSIIETQVAPAFRRGVDAITAAWESIREKAKAPVRFVVETIINHGLIDTFNKIAGYFGVDPVERIKLPEGFATGGYISGPGGPRDDLIPAMLSNGEFVVNAAAVKKLGVDFLSLLNRADRLDISGDIAGLVARRAAQNRFASGGLVDSVKRWLPSVDPLPYVWGGVGPSGFDCSGLVGEVWARITGHPSFRRYFTTSSGFPQFGFERGPGMFSMGVNPGQHMAGNLAGLPFEAASTKSGIHVGPRARSVASFPQLWHLSDLGGGLKLPSGNPPKGISLLHPIDSAKALLTSALGGLAAIADNPFGQVVAAVPKALVEGAISKVSDALPGFAGGGLVRKYDSGGYLPPGVTLAVNGTGRPEPVFTAAQFDRMRSGPGQATVQINQTITNPIPEEPSTSLTRGMRKVAQFGLIPTSS